MNIVKDYFRRWEFSLRVCLSPLIRPSGTFSRQEGRAKAQMTIALSRFFQRERVPDCADEKTRACHPC
jgi:hypothetical protein